MTDNTIHILTENGVTKMEPTVTINVDEMQKGIADRAVPEIPAEIDRVDFHVHDDGLITVRPMWKHVDRPEGIGYLVNRREADRLSRAIMAGVVFTNPFVTRDVEGNTYVSSGRSVMGRYLNADLKRLGF